MKITKKGTQRMKMNLLTTLVLFTSPVFAQDAFDDFTPIDPPPIETVATHGTFIEYARDELLDSVPSEPLTMEEAEAIAEELAKINNALESAALNMVIAETYYEPGTPSYDAYLQRASDLIKAAEEMLQDVWEDVDPV